MKYILITVNSDKDPNLEYSKKLASYIESKGGVAYILVRGPKVSEEIDLSVYERVDLILVLGGDGTMIRVARDIRTDKYPLIGLNMGHLGYLCELDKDNVYSALDAIFSGDYEIEERMLLTGSVETETVHLPKHYALNDIVLYRTGLSQIVSLRVFVDGKLLTNYNCDGVLFSTPTGSTAYNMSAGGPIVDPKASMILITPINPQALSQRTIVLDSNSEIVVEPVHRNEPDDAYVVNVSFDGDIAAQLKVGEQIHVNKSLISVKILKISQTSFVETLRKKLTNYD